MAETDPKSRPQKAPSHRRPIRKKKKSDYRHISTNGKFKEILHSPLAASEYIIFDIETTGGNPERNGLTEFCGLRVVEGEVVESFDSLINPQIPIPPIVRRMTGITDKMVRNAPTIDQVMPKILQFIGDRIVVSHNTIGDLKFIRYFAKSVCNVTFDNFFICTHLLSEKYLSDSPDKSLKGLADFLKVHFEGAHRAEADALITWKLFQELVKRAKQDGIESIEDLIRKQGDYESSFRLGWGVPEAKIREIPEKVGIYQGFDINKRLLYCGCGTNLRREVQSLKNYSELPKPMLKKVFHTYSISTEECPHLIAALKREAHINQTHNLSFTGRFLNQRRLLTFYVEVENDQLSLVAGHCPREAILAIGPLFDRKYAGVIMKRIADALDIPFKKNAITLTDAQFIAVYSYLTGQAEKAAATLSQQRQSVLNWFAKKKQRLYGAADLALQQLLVHLKGEHNFFCDLTALNGHYQYFTAKRTIECIIENSALKILREGPARTTIEPQKIESRDLPGLDIKQLTKVLQRRESRISEYEVWEYLCWSIFSNRGRKSVMFTPKQK